MAMRYAHLAPAHKLAAVERLAGRWRLEEATDTKSDTSAVGQAAESAIGCSLTSSRCVRLKESGRVAQLVEQCPFKAWVAGSNPAALTTSSSVLSNIPEPGARCFS